MESPEWLSSIGQWYEDFRQTPDEQVLALLERSAADPVLPPPTADQHAGPPGNGLEVVVPAGNVSLAGRLAVPENATGLVLLTHGSASNRHSPRQRYVADNVP